METSSKLLQPLIMNEDTSPQFSGLPYRQIADEVQTPVWILDRERLSANIDAFKSAQAGFAASETRTFYSLKTNYLPTVLETVRRAGWGADVVSSYELELAHRAGFSGTDIVYNGPFKTLPDLVRCAVEGILVNLDSPADARTASEAARVSGTTLEVGIRLTSPRSPYDGSLRRHQSKFGMLPTSADLDEVVGIIDMSNLRLVGVHCHLGSQIVSEEPYLGALKPVLDAVSTLAASHPIRTVNIGGGFGVPGISRVAVPMQDPSRPGEAEADFTFVAPDLRSWFESLSASWPTATDSSVELACEPGRVIVSDAMTILCTVVSIKQGASGKIVIVDGGVNLLPTAGPAESHAITFLGREVGYERAMVGGPLCYEGDVYSFDQLIPSDLAVGDLVLIHDAGAYSVTRSTSFNQLRAPVVEVSPNGYRVARRRETVMDLMIFDIE